MASSPCRRPRLSESVERERILLSRCTSPEAANALRNELHRIREYCQRRKGEVRKPVLADRGEERRIA